VIQDKEININITYSKSKLKSLSFDKANASIVCIKELSLLLSPLTN